MTSPVGRGETGPRGKTAPPKGRWAIKSGGRAAEGNPEMLQLIDGRDRFPAHQARRILVGQVVAPLDRIGRHAFPVVVLPASVSPGRR